MSPQEHGVLEMIYAELRDFRTEANAGFLRIHKRIDGEADIRRKLGEKVNQNSVSIAKVQVKTGVMSAVLGAVAGFLGSLGLK